MPDTTLESLKAVFMKDKDNIPADCEMADKVNAFALGELDAEEIKGVKDHIHSCRYCLDTYMDIRMAEPKIMEEKSESTAWAIWNVSQSIRLSNPEKSPTRRLIKRKKANRCIG